MNRQVTTSRTACLTLTIGRSPSVSFDEASPCSKHVSLHVLPSSTPASCDRTESGRRRSDAERMHQLVADASALNAFVGLAPENWSQYAPIRHGTPSQR